MQHPAISPRPLTRHDIKTLALAAVGGALEFYDFVIFAFFALVIGERFFPADLPDWLRQLQTFALFAAGYLARPLGGVILAHYGDKLGRKKTFTLSILMMALPTTVMGLLPDYASIGLAAPIIMLLLRVLQGAAIGGEVPGAWVFVSEHVPSSRVGVACGLLTSGLTLGIILGSLITQGLTYLLPAGLLADIGWRIAFLMGGGFGLMGMFLRRWLHETPVFLAMQQQRSQNHLPIKTLLLSHRSALFFSILLTWLLAAAIIVLVLMAPVLFQKWFAISAVQSLQANTLATCMLMIGCIGGGIAADKWGMSRSLIAGCLLLAAAILWLFYCLSFAPSQFFLAYGVVGLMLGVLGIIPAMMVMAFPPEVRFTGLATAYNIGYAMFGGLTPLFLTLLMPYNRQSPAIYLLALCAIAIASCLIFRRGQRRFSKKK
ncbi:MHS family MFS transporter [Rosenbergiella collisarenosi]|uniref:MFS transporter n=1 Tax=Rosenbergiella collisarenosi TaxID=1544695 RepID=UPI001BD9AFA9|nr:MFS transporter [Rosenbergiella collisarenosi]MBT0720039.1 MHS family MFS transporter [Rosenbergiella collisarenosi]